MKMSRKEFCANFSVVQKKISLQPKEEGSEVKSTVFWSVIHLLLNLKFYLMSIDALQEEFTHQVKVVQPLVSLLMYQKILRLVNLFQNQELLFSVTEVSAALMSLIRWTRMVEQFFMKQWSNICKNRTLHFPFAALHGQQRMECARRPCADILIVVALPRRGPASLPDCFCNPEVAVHGQQVYFPTLVTLCPGCLLGSS